MDESTSILTALEAQLSPDVIQKMSAQLGTDTAATSNAISMAVPILLGGLAKSAADADGAAALDRALSAHDGSILDNIGQLLETAQGRAGGEILGHVLGFRRTAVEDGLARATGLRAPQVGRLLMMIAPLVLGVLGRMRLEQTIGAEKLPEVLGQANLEMARQSPAMGDLSRILDGNHEGQIADDIASMGASVLGGVVATEPPR